MQGFILNVTKVKDEDLIVEILTPNSLIKSYRFYGARHLVIKLGYLIDFELNQNLKFLPTLRNIIHLGFSHLDKLEILYIYQNFIKLFYKHLKDSYELEEFYFELLKEINKKLQKQNPKRVILESYIKILKKEGRLHLENRCYFCEEKLKNHMNLARGFLPVCEKCDTNSNFKKNEILELFKSGSSINLSDEIVNKLYLIIEFGL